MHARRMTQTLRGNLIVVLFTYLFVIFPASLGLRTRRWISSRK